VFKTGKNHNGYFDADNLLAQVDNTIDIFKEHIHGFATALFLFDNALSHQKHAPNALSACRMPKNPKYGWSHHKDGPHIRATVLPNGNIQEFYFPDDHPQFPSYFKGMEQVIYEWGLWPALGTLLAQCEGLKCEAS